MNTTTTTITTTSRRLAALVGPVIPLADHTRYALPILAAVLLRGHGEHGMTALATDRYRIGVCRDEQIAAPVGFQAVVPVTALRSIVTMFRATKDHDPELTLEFVQDALSGVVHVGTQTLGLDIEGARITYRLMVGEYPKVDSVLASAFDGAEATAAPIGLNVRLLADFAAAARDGAPTVFYISKPMRPLGVAVGDHFRGAIMPLRITHDGTPPAPLDGAWSSLISPPAKTPALTTVKGA